MEVALLDEGDASLFLFKVFDEEEFFPALVVALAFGLTRFLAAATATPSSAACFSSSACAKSLFSNRTS